MKVSKEDKEGIQKVINGEISKWELLHFYTLVDIEEYLEKLGIEYADDSIYLHLYTITYTQNDTDFLFILNGDTNKKVQTFYKEFE